MFLSHGRIITALQFFTDRIDDYWHLLYPLTDPKVREKDPYAYFYDISRKATDFSGPFSDENIYLFKGYDGRWHLHALEIAQYALACWLAWRNTGTEVWKEKALRHCDWLVTHQADDGGWHIEHINPIYRDLSSPWRSALAQGLAISALIRAYRCTEDKRFLTAAQKAATVLTLEMKAGGLKRSFVMQGRKGFIYEEYPRTHLSGVLNGYISSMLGVYELCEFDSRWENVWHDNIANLLHILPLYDMGYWSYYALDGTVSSGFYHRYTCTQLKALSYLDKRFVPFAVQYERQLASWLGRFRAFLAKIL